MMSIESQVRWSFEVVSRPVMGRVFLGMNGDPGRGSLTEYERHAQAALMIRDCERMLPALHMAYIRLRFGHDPSGYDLVAQYVGARLGGDEASPDAIKKIIEAYCWDEVGLREVRKRLSCGMRKAMNYRNKVFKILDVLHREAINYLWKDWIFI